MIYTVACKRLGTPFFATSVLLSSFHSFLENTKITLILLIKLKTKKRKTILLRILKTVSCLTLCLLEIKSTSTCLTVHINRNVKPEVPTLLHAIQAHTYMPCMLPSNRTLFLIIKLFHIFRKSMF